MPFKSEKQRKWMWANEPEVAEEWEDEEDKKREGKIMKITKRQLRRIIREVGDYAPQRPRGTGLGATTPEAWADYNNLPLELDNEGQKIIYLDNKQAARLDMPAGVSWDAQRDLATDGWIIYTGEYQ